MRILFLSGLYATPLAPKKSIGNARILRAMRQFAEVQVMSPVPWYPAALAERLPSLKDTQLPAIERDVDGTMVLHPRRFHIPGAPVLQAALYTASLYGPLRREVRRFRPDVLLSAWAYPDGTAAAAFGRLFELPTVCRVMGTDINDFTKRADRRPQIALAFRHTDRVIAVSRALGDVVASLGVDPAKIVQIPTGVDTERFHAVDRMSAREELALPLEAPLIAVPSRLSPEKGIQHLLDALARMRDDVHVVLVGDGDQRAELEEQTARLGLGTRVHFAGYQLEHRMKMYYSAADLTCLPSLEEGWPDALMEAFACGCPVVASDVGGVADILALTGAGLLAPPGDPEGLGRVLEEALRRDWDREATAAEMQKHTLADTAKRYVETCADAAAAR